ncbi:hypothetical protein FACS1894123_03890 [Bacteroidia bacterium]|nr:hypothetical protein FACS1894123_03890 [Bacteroidia bacterium]
MKIKISENIDLTHPEKYILTIYFRTERFSFSLYDPLENGSYFYWESGKVGDTFSLSKNIFFDNEWFTFSFRKVYFMNYTFEFNYIPNLIYEDKYKKNFMQFLFPDNQGKVLHHSLQIADITILHQLSGEVYDFFIRGFVNIEFIHHTAPLIAYFQERSRIINGKQMIINKNKDGIDIICFSRGRFLMGNHFPCHSKREFVYYILFTWKQLDCDQQKDFLYVAGDNTAKKELMEQLQQYIHNVIPVHIVPEAHFEQIDMGNIPFELAVLSLCEL